VRLPAVDVQVADGQTIQVEFGEDTDVVTGVETIDVPFLNIKGPEFDDPGDAETRI
jgi:hypothetical protein